MKFSSNLFKSIARVKFALLLFVTSFTTGFAQTNYYSKSSATDFNALSSWGTATDGTGTAPTSISNADNFEIRNNAALTLTGAAAVRQLTITTGSLAVSANMLTVSRATGNNTTLLVAGGTLNLSGSGSIVLNGNYSMTSGATNQSGGSMSIDGNDGGANSVAAATSLFSITGGTPNFSAGSITLVDPPATAATARAINISITAGTSYFSGTHTFILGDGVSTTTGPAGGFSVETYSSGYAPIQNLTVNGGSASGRWAGVGLQSTLYGTHIKGILTVSAGSEVRQISTGQFAVGGDIINNGTFTTTNTLALGTNSAFTVTAAQNIGGTGIFRNLTASPTASFTNLTINNPVGIAFSPTALALGSYTGTVSGTFSLTAGSINTNGAAFILGVGTASLGTLTYTAGGFTSGSVFGRWYAAATAGTTIPASSLPSTSTNAGTYPFVSGANNRSFYINRPATTGATGGVIRVAYTDGSSLNTIAPVADGSYSIDRQSAANWAISTSNGFAAGTGTFLYAAAGQGIFTPLNANTRLMKAASVVGTHQAGTTLPLAQRAGIPAADYTGTFHLGINSNEIPVTTVQSGAWENPAIWSSGMVPSCMPAFILSGHTVTVSSTTTAANPSQINISAGGTVTQTGGNLTVGCTGNNNPLTNSGTLNISGGSLLVNGNVANLSGSIFSQTGGLISVDGNSGATATSVATGTSIFSLATSNVTLSGGTLVIVDPHLGTGSADYSFGYSGGANISATTGHTLQLGNGVSLDATTNAGGFVVEPYVGSNRLLLGNVTVNTSTSTGNRFVTSAFSTQTVQALGNLTVTSGEYRNGAILAVAGNITNNGTLTNTGTLTLQSGSGTSTTASVTTAQTISGTGIFRNLTANPTANFTNLTVNNTSSGGVTFATPNTVLTTGGSGTVSGTLTLTAGRITVSGGTPFVLGSGATSAGTLTYTAGGFSPGSSFARWLAVGTLPTTLSNTAPVFPFVEGTTPRHVYLSSPSNLATAGYLVATFNQGTGLNNVNFLDGTYQVDRQAVANWTFGTSIPSIAASTIASTTLSVGLNGSGLLTLQNVPGAAPRLTQAAGAAGTHVAATGTVSAPIANRSGLSVANLTGSAQYLGVGVADLPGLQTAQSGAWEDPATWVGGIVPSANTNAQIVTGHTVTVNAAPAEVLTLKVDGTLNITGSTLTATGNTGAGLQIVSGGAVSVSGGTVNVASTNISVYNSALSNSGTFAISGSGTLNIFGNLASLSGSTFSQTGGTINVDGNKDNTAVNGVASGTPLVSFRTANLTLSGGTLNIVDPHPATTTTLALEYSATGAVNSTAAHTLKFGDGTTGNNGGTTSGFGVNLGSGSNRLLLGQLLVDAPGGTNRAVTQVANSFGIAGNLVITSGSELVNSQGIYVPADITNNGILTTTGTLFLASFANGTAAAATGAQSIGGAGLFRNLASSPTANFSALTVNNTSAAGVAFANANALLSGANTGTVSGQFTLTAGKISTGSAAFILGINNTTAITSPTFTAGGFTSGSTYGRWWTAAQTGTSITANTATSSSSPSRYPFLSAGNADRSAFVQRGGTVPTSGGLITAKYTDASTISTVNILDASPAYTVDRRSDAYWEFGAGGGFTSSTTSGSTFTIEVVGSGLYVAALNTSRITTANGIVGTHLGATTAPRAQRTGLSFNDLTVSGPFYIGINSSDLLFVSAQSGDWNTPSTWNQNVVPGASNVVQIAAGHTVTVNAAAAALNASVAATGTLAVSAGTLAIGGTLANSGAVTVSGGAVTVTGASTTGINNASGATFTVGGGTVTLGPTAASANTTTFSNTGTLTVSSGTLNVFGNMTHASGSTFNQSGGSINLDGNAGGVAANSVASGVVILQLNSQNINWTGGTLAIIDPHAATTATNIIAYDNGTSVAATIAHTLVIGNGISSDTGGNAIGSRIDSWVGSGRLHLGNVLVTGPGNGVAATTNRLFVSQYSLGIRGNLTIDNGGEYRSSTEVVVGGDVLVNSGGILTSSSTLNMALYNTGGIVASTIAQSIGGAGSIRNSAMSPTDNLVSLAVNNSSASGVTLFVPLTLSGTLTLTAGKLNTSSGNLLTVNGITTGSISGGSNTAYVNGPLARKFPANKASGSFFSFPIGKANYAPLALDPVTGTGGPVTILAEAFDTNPGTGSPAFVNFNANRRWETSFVAGAGDFVSADVRIGDAAIASQSGIGMATDAYGVYEVITSTYASGTSSTPPTLVSSGQIPASSYTGVFGFGDQGALNLGNITATQQTGMFLPGSNNNNMLRIEIPATGALGSITLSELTVAYTGTTASDVAASGVTLWTGTASAPTTQVGTAQSFAGVVATFTGLTVPIASGTRYVWVRLNAASLVTPGNAVDVKIPQGGMTFVTVAPATASAPQPPIDLDPAGNRTTNYCLPTYTSGCGSTGADAVTSVSLGTFTSTSLCAASPYYTLYNNATIPTIQQGGNAAVSISFGSNSSQFAGVWIDFDQNGVFAASEGVVSTTTAGANGTVLLTLPVPAGAALGNTRMRIRGGDDAALTTAQACGASNSNWGEGEDYTVQVTAPSDAAVGTLAAIHPQSTSVTVGSTSVALLRVEIPTTGTSGTLTLDALTAAYTGTAASDVAASGVKLWAGSATAPVTQLGAAQSLSGGAVTFSGLNRLLANSASNYFWLTLDVATTASIGNVLDLKIPAGSILISAGGTAISPGTQPPTDLDPAGSRALDYCAPIYTSGCGQNDEIKTVELGALNNTSACAASAPFYTFFGSATIPTLEQGTSNALTITFGTDGTQYSGVWVDYNRNGIFETAEGLVASTAAGSNGSTTYTLAVPLGAVPGNTRMRIRGGDDYALSTSQACGTTNGNFGETEDYIVQITPATNATIGTITATQQSGTVQTASTNNNLLRIAVPVTGALGSFTLNSLTVTYTGTATTDVAANGVKLFAGTATAPGTALGTAQSLSGSTATFSGLTQTLTNSATNYFWIAMNVAPTALVGNTIDAKISAGDISITAGGSAVSPGTQPPTDLDPAGSRLIDYCTPTYSTGCGATGQNAITAVTLGTLNNATTCATSPYYTFFNTVTAPSVQQGLSYPVGVSMGTDANQFAAVWIDFNGNGLFETSEGFVSTANAGAGGTATINVAVPLNAVVGTTRMRVRGGNDLVLTTAQACGNSSDVDGETEDYLVTISAAPNCSTATFPATATTTSNIATVCNGSSIAYTFAASASMPVASGITYQLQYDGGSGWIDVGAPSATPTVTYTTTLAGNYRVDARCNGSSALPASSVTITVNNPLITGTTPGSTCGTGSAILAASSSPGTQPYWYSAASGGLVLAQAAGTFTTPNISTNTTYYTSALISAQTGSAGVQPTGTACGTISATSFTDYPLRFTTTAPVTIHSAVVVPYAAGAFTVALRAVASTTNIQTASYTFTAAQVGVPQRIALDMAVPVGNYQLTNTVGGVSRISTFTCNYPFTTLGGKFSVVGSANFSSDALNTTSTTTYNSFYDLTVTECQSARTAVTATVVQPPAVTTQPVAQTACAGNTATFSVTATNAGAYQWRRNGFNIAGANSSTYTTPSLTPADSGASYDVVLTPAGPPCTANVASAAATLTVTKHIWTGTTSTAWSDATNWSGCGVPTATSYVEIPATAPFMPIVSSVVEIWMMSSVGNVTVDPGAALNILGQ